MKSLACDLMAPDLALGSKPLFKCGTRSGSTRSEEAGPLLDVLASLVVYGLRFSSWGALFAAWTRRRGSVR